MKLTAQQRAALKFLAGVRFAAPSAIGQAMEEARGSTRIRTQQGLGRIGGGMASRLVKMGLAAHDNHARQGFPAYSINAAGRAAIKEGM